MSIGVSSLVEMLQALSFSHVFTRNMGARCQQYSICSNQRKRAESLLCRGSIRFRSPSIIEDEELRSLGSRGGASVRVYGSIVDLQHMLSDVL